MEARTQPGTVTPAGVRDGDPQVLAALCARRGPSVVAFAEQICPSDRVTRTAADGFARFRAAVAVEGEAATMHPDALLLRCARRAALELWPAGPDIGCGAAPALLASRAERTLSEHDAPRLEHHLRSCGWCGDLAARLERAEQAYRTADESPLAPERTSAIVAAMAAAAPVRWRPAAPQGPNGQVAAAPQPDPEPDPVSAPEPAPEPDPQPDPGLVPRDIPAAPPVPYDEVPDAPSPAQRRSRRRRRAAGLAQRTGAIAGVAASATRRAGTSARKVLERPPRAGATQPFDQEPASPQPMTEPPREEPPPAVLSPSGPSRDRRRARRRDPGAPEGRLVPPRLPRPPRERVHAPLSAHSPRDLALPAGLLVVAALVILAVAGVFGGAEAPAPTAVRPARTATPASTASGSSTALSLAAARRISVAGPGSP